MNIFNGTSHAINVFSVADTYPIQGGRKLVVKPGAVPIYVIPSGEVFLDATKENMPAPKLDSPIRLVGAVKFTGRDMLPDGYDLYIVSQIYRAATIELGYDPRKLATVDGTVYETEDAIRPCGCTGLAVG